MVLQQRDGGRVSRHLGEESGRWRELWYQHLEEGVCPIIGKPMGSGAEMGRGSRGGARGGHPMDSVHQSVELKVCCQ